MDIKKLSVIELKALAYDEVAKFNIAQENIAIINKELKNRSEIKSVPETTPTETTI